MFLSDTDTLGFSTNGVQNLTINPSGNVGIGTDSPSEKLHVNGNVLAAAYLYSSDVRLKKDIHTVASALEKVSTLRGVTFNWRAPASAPEKKLQLGLIAQDVEAVFPEAVVTTDDGVKRVNYPALIAPVIEALKELWTQLTGVNERVAEVERENVELRQRVDRLERALCAKDPALCAAGKEE